MHIGMIQGTANAGDLLISVWYNRISPHKEGDSEVCALCKPVLEASYEHLGRRHGPDKGKYRFTVYQYINMRDSRFLTKAVSCFPYLPYGTSSSLISPESSYRGGRQSPGLSHIDQINDIDDLLVFPPYVYIDGGVWRDLEVEMWVSSVGLRICRICEVVYYAL